MLLSKLVEYLYNANHSATSSCLNLAPAQPRKVRRLITLPHLPGLRSPLPRIAKQFHDSHCNDSPSLGPFRTAQNHNLRPALIGPSLVSLFFNPGQFHPNLLHDGPVPMEHITPLHVSTLPLENSPRILVAYQSPLSHPRPSRLPFCPPCHKKHPQPTLRTTAFLETGQLAGLPEPKLRGNQLFNPSPSTLRRKLGRISLGTGA